MSRRQAGFTLIEVIVVLAILGLVLMMLGQGSRAGLKALEGYRRATRNYDGFAPVELALRRMIERMDPGVYPNAPIVVGSPHTLVFTTELPDVTAGGTLTADVRLQSANGQLLLSWTPHARGVPFAAPPALHREVMLDGISGLDVSYAGGRTRAGWETNWAQPALPGFVRLRLVGPDGTRPWPTIIARPRREQAEE